VAATSALPPASTVRRDNDGKTDGSADMRCPLHDLLWRQRTAAASWVPARP
jgi:hypothetical protein